MVFLTQFPFQRISNYPIYLGISLTQTFSAISFKRQTTVHTITMSQSLSGTVLIFSTNQNLQLACKMIRNYISGFSNTRFLQIVSSLLHPSKESIQVFITRENLMQKFYEIFKILKIQKRIVSAELLAEIRYLVCSRKGCSKL